MNASPFTGPSARVSEDLVHAVVFPTCPVFGGVPHKDSQLRNLGCQLQPRLALAQPSSSHHDFGCIAVGIVNTRNLAVLIDRDQGIVPIVVFDHSIQEDGDEHVVSYRGFASIKTALQIGAHQVPRLTEDIAVQGAERAGMLSSQGGDSCVVVKEHHLRTPRQDRWKR